MSASKLLQTLIKARLERALTFTVGDGDETEFPLVHNFAMYAAPAVRVVAGSAVLVEGTDYELEATDINTVTITALGDDAPATDAWTVRVAVLSGDGIPVIDQRDKQLEKKIEQAAANRGLCVLVMPSLPMEAQQGSPEVFFSAVEVRVRIVEKPAISAKFGADAYDLVDDIAAGLHWQLFGEILSHPLELAQRCTDPAQDPVMRIIDVIFTAVYGLRPVGG
jgi:hypothetical protein